jgi:hypothetical protein
MRAIEWLFDSPRRFYSVSGWLVAVIVIMVTAALVATAADDAAPAVQPSVTASHPELVPPTSPTPTQSPTPYQQPSQPVALEAVSAWLRYDLDDFGAVASPAALEAVSEAHRPAGGQEIEGSRVELGGPGRQTVLVDISTGRLELVMVLDGERWIVQSMRYVE